MRVMLTILRKEFRQIFRDPAILRIIFVVPIIQFIILPFAANYEFRNINLVLVDHDHSGYSQQLINKITGSNYFRLVDNSSNFTAAYRYIEDDKADLILEIPSGFERNLVREHQEEVFIAVNAINGIKASLGGNYLTSIIADYSRDITIQLTSPEGSEKAGIEIAVMPWFNPQENYKIFIVPGILGLLVSVIGALLAIFIVKEKEIGTIEQINVTPIKKYQFLMGKLIPFWIIGNFVFSIGLTLGYFIYHIAPAGSLFVLYIFLAVYLLTVLGLSLFISTFCQTQQQAMFVGFFFLIIFILLSGLFTPIESMPVWAQWVTKFNPISYMIQVMRMVILKGSDLRDILPQLATVSLMAVTLLTLSVLNYRKMS